MPNEPLISVIVPLYCAQAYLSRCVESILKQTHANLELILVNDGSPDDCPAICDRYALADGRVRVIHQENKGVSAARNAGIDLAAGEYLAFADADDWVEPDYLSYLLEIVSQNHVRLSACNHYVFARGKDHAKFPVRDTAEILPLRQAMERTLYHQPPDVSAWGKLYHRSLFETLRYPEGTIFEDTDLFADLLIAAGELAYGASPKYHYQFLARSLSKAAFSETSWAYLDAVERLNAAALTRFPDLAAATTRRRVHAALSIRRLLVHAGKKHNDDVARCESIIRAGARTVLRDERAPLRDKAGILLALAGRVVFDSVWGLYERVRRDY